MKQKVFTRAQNSNGHVSNILLNILVFVENFINKILTLKKIGFQSKHYIKQ